MNNVVLMGRLTSDPVVNMGTSGTSIVRFNVACDRRFKSEGQPTADFISCLAFGKTAEFIEKYFKKGSRICLEGRIQTGSYEKDGKKIYTTDVVVENVEFSESKGSAKAETTEDGFAPIPDDVDDMPFN